MAGLDSRLASHLGQQLPGNSIVELAAGDLGLQEALEKPSDLLIIDHAFAAPHAGGTPALPGQTPELLVRLRRTSPELPVIYCLEPEAEGKFVRQLILEFKVNEILFHPVDADELARKIASLLGLRFESETAIDIGYAAGSRSGLNARLADAWKRSRSRMLERLELLDSASAALLEGRLEPGLRKQAEMDAHRMAGSLGTFGLDAGSRFAREMEHALGSDSMRSPAHARRFQELAAALRAEIERSGSAGVLPAFSEERAGRPRYLLLVENDADLAARLIEQAAARGSSWEAAADLAAARAALNLNPLAGSSTATLGCAKEKAQAVTRHSQEWLCHCPSAVLVDMDATGHDEMLAFLSELSGRRPPLPVLVLTSGGNLMDRVEVVRLGGCGFFPRGLPPDEIVEAALATLERVTSPPARVLAVDDDPAVLDVLASLLGSSAIRLNGLSDPLRFWDALEGSPPDLLLLDIQMPSVSGIELCRVMRNDPRWAATPVIFLTSVTDRSTVERAFASGADDFIAKPIAGPELVTRITNRLERTRLLRNAAEKDQLSGLANRLRFRRAFSDFLALADRHGQPMGLALLNVDRLDRINETHGLAAGDEVVRQLGSHLRHEFRSEEIPARWGGNDFTVGLYGLDRAGSVQRIGEVLRTFGQRFFIGASAEEFRVTLSGGVAAYPDDGSGLDGLLRAAGHARLRACEAGGDRLLVACSAPQTWDGICLIDLAVVTGDEATASVLEDAFERNGYSVRALRHGLAAARTLCGLHKTLRPRVMLIDLELPFIDGLTLFRRLAAEGALEHSRAIVLSSASMGREAALALELGAEDHVARPVDLPVLIERVQRTLESPGPQSGLVERFGIATDAVCSHASPGRLN